MTIAWIALAAAALLSMHLKLLLIRRGFESTLRVLGDDISQGFEGLHERERMQHLEIMKVLKGESYVGQIGGLDMHVEPLIPTSHAILYNKKDFLSDFHPEMDHAVQMQEAEDDGRC